MTTGEKVVNLFYTFIFHYGGANQRPESKKKKTAIENMLLKLSQPKLNQQLSSTVIDPPTPHRLSLYTQNLTELTTAQLASRDLCTSVQSHTDQCSHSVGVEAQ